MDSLQLGITIDASEQAIQDRADASADNADLQNLLQEQLRLQEVYITELISRYLRSEVTHAPLILITSSLS